MKKNFKTLQVLGGITLVSSVCIVPLSIMHKQVVSTKNTQYIKSTEIDTSDYSKDKIVDDIFNNNDVLVAINSKNNMKNEQPSDNYSNEAKDFVKNRVDVAMRYIQNNGIDSNFVDNYMPENANLYKSIFAGDFSELNTNTNTIDTSLLQNWNVFYIETRIGNGNYIPFNELSALVQNLRISRVTFVSASAVAATLSAGLWAAAWWFGISIPGAIHAGIAAAVLGGTASAINIALLSVDPILSNINMATATFGSIISLGRLLSNVLKPILIGAQVSLTAASWIFPLAWAIVPITSWLIASFTYFY